MNTTRRMMELRKKLDHAPPCAQCQRWTCMRCGADRTVPIGAPARHRCERCREVTQGELQPVRHLAPAHRE